MSERCCRHTYCQTYTGDPTGYCDGHHDWARSQFRGQVRAIASQRLEKFNHADIVWVQGFDPDLAKLMQDANTACAKVRDYCECKLESTAQLRADRIEQEGR